jgi:hypothetical protein
MQKTREIIRQVNQGMRQSGQAVDQAEDNVAQAVREDAATKVAPELKKKTSGTGEKSVEKMQTEYTRQDVTIQEPPEIPDPDYIEAWQRQREGINLDGSTQIQLGYDNVPSWDSYSVSIWFLKDPVPGQHAAWWLERPPYGEKLIDKTDWYQDWSISFYGGGIAFITRQVGGAEGNNMGIGDYDYRDGQWHQLVLTVNGSHGELWVDNNLKAQSDNLLSSSNDVPLTLGYSNSGDLYQNNYWSGKIDEVAIFDKALTGSDINNMWKYGTNLSDSNMKINYSVNEFSYKAQQMVSNPNFKTTLPDTGRSASGDFQNQSLSQNMYGDRNISAASVFNDMSSDKLDPKIVAAVFKNMLDNKNLDVQIGSGAFVDTPIMTGLSNDLLGASAIAAPLGPDASGQEVGFAIILANILKNPTEDQKLILDAMTSLLKDVNKLEQDSVSPEAVRKAEGDFLQVVANILIAQAIPDLLKEGDVAAIKATFEELNTQKTRLISDYNLAVQPYYKEVKKLLAKNLALLQFNNIVSKTMVEDELSKLEPNDVDKLLEKLRKISGQSQDADSLLSQEDKLHKQYLDPNKKLFEDRMKAMLEGFTQRLSKILEAKKGK